MSINVFTATGHLTRDPELRQSQSGTPILHFSIAINDNRRDSKTGEWKTYANFVDCTMFGNRAEALFNKLSKGQKVGIVGSLRWNQWEVNGEKRTKHEIVVTNIDLMGSSAGRESQGEAGETASKPAGQSGDAELADQTSFEPAAPAAEPYQSVAVQDAVFEKVHF